MPPTKSCLICFKKIKINDICRLFNDSIDICRSCQTEMEPKFIAFKAEGYSAVAIYEYNAIIKKLVYQYKGCYDYVLNQAFLNMYAKELKIHYSDYIVVPVPSFKKDDEIRGFNHVVEVFKQTGLEIYQIIEKTEHFKQADKSAKERQMVSKYLRLTNNKNLKKQKVLIVDDIYTTGATMRSMIKLIENLNPKEIKILVLVKTKDIEDKKSNTKQSLH